jgi:hypothetical protein
MWGAHSPTISVRAAFYAELHGSQLEMAPGIPRQRRIRRVLQGIGRTNKTGAGAAPASTSEARPMPLTKNN